jgi:hypothetical protein
LYYCTAETEYGVTRPPSPDTLIHDSSLLLHLETFFPLFPPIIPPGNLPPSSPSKKKIRSVVLSIQPKSAPYFQTLEVEEKGLGKLTNPPLHLHSSVAPSSCTTLPRSPRTLQLDSSTALQPFLQWMILIYSLLAPSSLSLFQRALVQYFSRSFAADATVSSYVPLPFSCCMWKVASPSYRQFFSRRIQARRTSFS